MSRPPAAREAVLDAFERILIDEGERAATLDAVAKAAGVSKGGLLYHFASKDALAEGLLDRLTSRIDEDVLAIDQAPEGAVAYFLRSSIELETPLDRAFVATTRLAQGGHTGARTALRSVRRRWFDAVHAHVPDATAARLVTLVGDALYYDSALLDAESGLDLPRGPALDELVALVVRVVDASPGSEARSEGAPTR